MRTAPWWLRRDLRLADNQALSAALTEAEQVIPVFALDPALLDSPRAGPKRVAFLMGGLQELGEDLRTGGGRMRRRLGPGHMGAPIQCQTSREGTVGR